MKDDKGHYYYPYPQNKQVRMYVLKIGDDICFRMWDLGQPELWEKHGWVPYDAIKQAMGMFTGKGFDPAQAYDLDAARDLLGEV